jgi:hypothetical protein
MRYIFMNSRHLKYEVTVYKCTTILYQLPNLSNQEIIRYYTQTVKFLYRWQRVQVLFT